MGKKKLKIPADDLLFGKNVKKLHEAIKEADKELWE